MHKTAWLLVMASLVSLCQPSFAEDLSGRWTLRFSPPATLKYWQAFELQLPIELNQNGNSIKGTTSWCTGLGPSDFPIKQKQTIIGSLAGPKQVTFQFQVAGERPVNDIWLNGLISGYRIEGELRPSAEVNATGIPLIGSRISSRRFIMEKDLSLNGSWLLSFSGANNPNRHSSSFDLKLSVREKDGKVEGSARDYSAPVYAPREYDYKRQAYKSQRVSFVGWKVSGRSVKGAIELTLVAPTGGTAHLLGRVSGRDQFSGTIQKTASGFSPNSSINKVQQGSTFLLELEPERR